MQTGARQSRQKLKSSLAKTFNRAIKKNDRDTKGQLIHAAQDRLSEFFSISARAIRYWSGQEVSQNRALPAYALPGICKVLSDFSLLDLLEQEVGRVAFVIPDVAKDRMAINDVREIQKLTMEVGQALESLADTLQDGKVEDHELEKTIPELDDVIRECTKLKHWLKARNERDNRRSVKMKVGNK